MTSSGQPTLVFMKSQEFQPSSVFGASGHAPQAGCQHRELAGKRNCRVGVLPGRAVEFKAHKFRISEKMRLK